MAKITDNDIDTEISARKPTPTDNVTTGTEHDGDHEYLKDMTMATSRLSTVTDTTEITTTKLPPLAAPTGDAPTDIDQHDNDDYRGHLRDAPTQAPKPTPNLDLDKGSQARELPDPVKVKLPDRVRAPWPGPGALASGREILFT